MNELEQLLNDLKELGKDNGEYSDVCKKFMGVESCTKCPYPDLYCNETVAAVTAERLEEIMQNDPVKEAEEICEQITPPEQDREPKPVHVGDVKPFPNVKPDKAQALKVLEEAAEVFGAWQEWEQAKDNYSKKRLFHEIADVMQACVNLLAAYNVENFHLYVQICEERNRARGRYNAR